MKKIIALLLVLAMALSIAACGKDSADPTGNSTNPPADGGSTTPSGTTGPTEPQLKVEDLVPGEGVFTKVSYSVSDDDIIAAKDTVVGTCGEAGLTNGVLQIYYWMGVYDFLSQYGAYANYFGLDFTKPLDQQICPDTKGTWQHDFLSGAINGWHSYQSMALMGAAKEIPMKEDLKTALSTLKTELEKSAKENKYESVDAMLQADVGKGVTYEDYYKYMEVYYQGYSYFDHMYTSFEVSDADIEDYYTKNEKDLKEAGYAKDAGKYYDVRHILIQPEGGTKDDKGNTTFSDAEWEACRQKAQGILNDFLAGEATEEAFAKLATEKTMDDGSKQDGGLYTYLDKNTSFVQEFKDWYLDESRKPGDTGLVKSVYGYHIMYFSASQDIWYAQCRDAIFNEKSQAVMEEAVKAYPVEMDYEKVALGFVDLTPKEETKK